MVVARGFSDGGEELRGDEGSEVFLQSRAVSIGMDGLVYVDRLKERAERFLDGSRIGRGAPRVDHRQEVFAVEYGRRT